MSEAASVLRLEVGAGDDVLRQERLTRELRDALVTLAGIDVAFGAPAGPSGEGRKGTVETVLTLIATITALGRPAAQVLITASRSGVFGTAAELSVSKTATDR